MSQTAEIRATTALAITPPERLFTRSGTSFAPRADVWEWTDGPFEPRIDFGRYSNGFEQFVPALKSCLAPFVKGHSSSHITNLEGVFFHFVGKIGSCPAGAFNAQHVADYAAALAAHEMWRLGTLNGLVQKWVELRLPGMSEECATYLLERRKPGNTKGHAVKTRDPIKGPLSEEEYTALYSAVNAAYGRNELPLWTLLLMRLLLACGGRISQFASLKVCDFDGPTAVFSLPLAKTGEKHSRTSFLQFDLSPQTARLVTDYLEGLRKEGYEENAPFFPAAIVMPRGPRKARRAESDLFYGHCTPHILSGRFSQLLAEVTPPTARLDFAPMPVTAQRFRYTFGTRLAEEGASQIVIANRLGHADLQQVEVYVAASPKIVESIDASMGELLAPLSQAFKGRVVEDEMYTTHKGTPESRIIDFRVSTAPVGSCAGKKGGCSFNKPVACYTCFRFEPWLDAPHEKILHRLQDDRRKWSNDERMAAVNDEPIRAVQEVIALCAQVWEQRSAKAEATA